MATPTPKCGMTAAKVEMKPVPTHPGNGLRVDPRMTPEQRKADILYQIRNRPPIIREILLKVL